jgi:hypothetical protein
MFAEVSVGDGRHKYRVEAYGEGGVVARTTELELDVPEDCVPAEALELDWQQLVFAVPCHDQSPMLDVNAFPEMTAEFSTPGACLPVHEPLPDLGELVSAEPAPPPIASTQVPVASAPAAPVVTPSANRAGSGTQASGCRFDATASAGQGVSFLVALVALALARRRRR